MNGGKQFEQDIRESAKHEPSISLDRLYDTQGGLKGVRTICDFIAYKYPFQHYLELKSYKTNTIPLTAVTPFQFNGLMEKSKIHGVTAGVLLNFQAHENTTVWLPIESVALCHDHGIKSFTIDFVKREGIPLAYDRRITRYRYDLHKLFCQIEERVK